jgi:hypothetical protein
MVESGENALYDLCRQRWKTETVDSVVKRKFGDTIRFRKRSLQW